MQNKRKLKKKQTKTTVNVTWFFYAPFQTPTKFESRISNDWTLHL